LNEHEKKINAVENKFIFLQKKVDHLKNNLKVVKQHKLINDLDISGIPKNFLVK